MRVYELMPIDNHKSFYGKAKVVEEGGTRTLYSYNTPVVRENHDGTLERLWGGWTATTGRHIRSFCNIGKAEWDKMDVVG